MADGSRILLVEDDPALAREIVRALERDHWPIDHVARSPKPSKRSSRFTYRVILLDRRLPDGDGIGLIPAARSRPSPPSIIFLTARDDLADRVEGLDAGADDYLVKPFALEELLARLRAACRRPGQTSKAGADRGRRPVLRPGHTRGAREGPGDRIAPPRARLAGVARPPRGPGGPAGASRIRALRSRHGRLGQCAGRVGLAPAPAPRGSGRRSGAEDCARGRLHAPPMLIRTPSLALRAGLIFMTIYTMIFVVLVIVAMHSNSRRFRFGPASGRQRRSEVRRERASGCGGSLELPRDGNFGRLSAENPPLWLLARRGGRSISVGPVPGSAAAAFRSIRKSPQIRPP